MDVCYVMPEAQQRSLEPVLTCAVGGAKHFQNPLWRTVPTNCFKAHTHQRAGNGFLRFLGAQLFHSVVVFLLFFCHEDILTSKVKGSKEERNLVTIGSFTLRERDHSPGCALTTHNEWEAASTLHQHLIVTELPLEPSVALVWTARFP